MCLMNWFPGAVVQRAPGLLRQNGESTASLRRTQSVEKLTERVPQRIASAAGFVMVQAETTVAMSA